MERVLLVLLIQATVSLASCSRTAPPVRPLDQPPPREASSAEAAPASLEALLSNPLDGGEAEPSDAPAWLGVELALRSPEAPGVLIRGVVPGSPAERAGLAKDDVILSIDGRGVGRPAEIVSLVSERRAGERIAVTSLRGDRERLFAVTLEPLPNDEALMKRRYVDAAAPALTDLKTVTGSVNPNLNALRGNVVIVEFWAGWCVPCRITAPMLSSWNDRYSAEGLRVLGVTSDPVTEAADGAERHGMTYPVFSDESGSTTLSYRAFALPTLFVIDRRGVVRDVMVGFSTSRLQEIEALVGRLLAER